MVAKRYYWDLYQRVFSLFSSRGFILSGFTCRSLMYFEFIFIYGVRGCSSFILLHVAIQFPQHHLLKRLSFLCCKLQQGHFFDSLPRVMKIKTKINKWNLIKLKTFHTAKEIINKMKRQDENLQNGRKYLQTKQLTKD